MSNLIMLRNKIRTVQTIEKITRTMRLIAMSEHTLLQKSGGQLKVYIDHIKQLLKKITLIKQYTQKTDHTLMPDYKKEYLCIIIGSQKGLCGNFNSKLVPIIETFLQDKMIEDIDFALIGKQVFSLMSSYQKTSIVYAENSLTHRNKEHIIATLINLFPYYQKVYIISNQFKTFFSQPSTLSLISIPSDIVTAEHDKGISMEQYIFEENIDDIFQVLSTNYIRSQFSYFLHQSLLAEHAARFTAMDSATKNAEHVLEETKVLFNKLRQAKITTEITELSSNF